MNPKVSWLKPWMVNMTFDIIVAAILIIVSTWRIKPVKTVKGLLSCKRKRGFKTRGEK